MMNPAPTAPIPKSLRSGLAARWFKLRSSCTYAPDMNFTLNVHDVNQTFMILSRSVRKTPLQYVNIKPSSSEPRGRRLTFPRHRAGGVSDPFLLRPPLEPSELSSISSLILKLQE